MALDFKIGLEQNFISSKIIKLKSGEKLNGFHLTYHTYGTLNKTCDNVIWVFHALTANSAVHEWWPNMIGNGKIFDYSKYFIICVNKPGSYYGSISPLSKMSNNIKYGFQFPIFTIKDIITCFEELKKALKIKSIYLGIGGSTGGMQLLEWACKEPTLFKNIIPLVTNAIASPWLIAFNSSQRMAIEADKNFYNTNLKGGEKGLAVARSIAILSYRHYDGYNKSQPLKKIPNIKSKDITFAADSYQRYQGKKLVARFNPLCYYNLTKTMDSHNVASNRKTVEENLALIKSNCLVIGIDTDILYPIKEQQFIVKHIPNSKLIILKSFYGHDGFLVEEKQLEKKIKLFLKKNN